MLTVGTAGPQAPRQGARQSSARRRLSATSTTIRCVGVIGNSARSRIVARSSLLSRIRSAISARRADSVGLMSGVVCAHGAHGCRLGGDLRRGCGA